MTPTTGPTRERGCHACGAAAPIAARYCPACGAELEHGRRPTRAGRAYWILVIGTAVAAALGGLALYRLATPPPAAPAAISTPPDDTAWSGLSAADVAAGRAALDAAIEREETAARAALRTDGAPPPR